MSLPFKKKGNIAVIAPTQAKQLGIHFNPVDIMGGDIGPRANSLEINSTKTHPKAKPKMGAIKFQSLS